MENTISDQEFARIPNAAEAASLASAVSVFMGQPILADADRIVASVDWADGSLTVAAQPDVPRNLTVALTDADNSVSGLLTITGLDMNGNTVVETMTPDAAGGGKTLTGTKIFASVTSAVISGTAGAAPGTDTVVIGVGEVIGLPYDLIHSAAISDVYLGGARVAAPVLATGASTTGIDVSAATYDGSKIMWAIVKPAYTA